MSRLISFGFVVALSYAVLAPAPASAWYTYDKLAYLTFSGPVQVPGATLAAGTYQFRLADPGTSRKVLQVLSHDGKSVIAMFHTITDSRMEVEDDPIVTFRETPAGVPLAVRSLFYGGEHRGYEFVYPKGGPIMVAKVAPQPEITYTPIPAPAAAEPVAEAEPIAEPVIEPAVEQAPVSAPVELPRTASPLPLLALGGLTSLLGGLGLGLFGRRVK